MNSDLPECPLVKFFDCQVIYSELEFMLKFVEISAGMHSESVVELHLAWRYASYTISYKS